MLSEIDIEILNFIYKNNEVHISKILENFPEYLYSTSFRLIQLKGIEYRYNENIRMKIPVENNAYLNSESDIYFLTKLGKTFVENHNRFIKNKKIDFRKQFALELMRSVLFPIIVSFITALITIYINKTFNFV